MSQELYPKIGKLLVAQKIPDRTLTTFVHEPTKFQEAKMGNLYFLIEVKSPYQPASEIAQLIIRATIDHYYQSSDEDEADRFEKTLRAVNEKLTEKLKTSKSVEWAKNLNAVILLFSKSKIHLSSAGDIKSYLFRDTTFNQINEISEPGEIKFFSYLTSGNIESDDKILLFNSELERHLAIQKIREMIPAVTLPELIFNIAKPLKEDKVFNVNSLIIDFTDNPDAQGLKPEVAYLDHKEAGWLEKTISKAAPRASIKEEETKPIVPETMEEKETPRQDFSQILRRSVIWIGKISILAGQSIKGRARGTSRREVAREKIKQWREEARIPTKNISREEGRGLVRDSGQGIAKFFKNFFFYLALGIKSLFLPERRKLSLALLVIIIIIISILGFMTYRRTNERKVERQKAEQALVLADQKLQEGILVLTDRKKDDARKLFLESLDLANQAKTFPQLEERANKIYSDAQSRLDTMDNIKRLSFLKEVTNFSKIDTNINLKQIVVIDDKIYTINSKNNKIYIFDPNTNEQKVAGSLPQIAGTLQSATDFSEREILIYTSDRKMYRFTPGNEQAEKVEIITGEDWEEATEIASYQNNLYLLDPKQGQIYRHSASGSGFTKGRTQVNASNVNISGAVSITIDGYIYVLKSKEISKLLKGNYDKEFKFRGLPDPLNQIGEGTKVTTNTKLSVAFILDNGNRRIIEIDKDGLYVRQFIFSDEFSGVSDILIGPKNKKLYLLYNNRLYEIEL